MSALPDCLEFSSRALLDMILSPADRFTARDLSYALSALYLARDMSPDAGNLYHLPDNRLRGSLGLTRRDRDEIEDARFVRLARSAVMFDDLNPRPLPTTLFQTRSGVDYPVRHNLDDQLGWVIDPDLIARFKPQSVGDTTSVPRALLAGATKLHALVFILKLLALHAEGPGQPNLLEWSEQVFAMKMGLPDLCQRFGIVGARPAALSERYFKPAIDDAWSSCGISVDVELNRTYTHRNPKGRVRDATVFLRLPEPSRIAALIETEREARVSTEWRSGNANVPKSSKPRPKSTNIVAFQGRPATIPHLQLPEPGEPAATATATATVGDTFDF